MSYWALPASLTIPTSIAEVLSNRASDATDTAPWRNQDIAYVAIIGIVMLAAVLEWTLWLLAFSYCLYQVYVKADGAQRWSTRAMAVVILSFFVAMRLIFLPTMAVTLPLPSQIVKWFSPAFVSILQWFAFYTFAGLLTLPWLVCIYQTVKLDLLRWRESRRSLVHESNSKVVIVMPCYHEEPAILLRTINSIADCDYPASCLHIFLSFDGDMVDDLYLNTLDKLGVPLSLTSYPRSIDMVYRRCRITISRFKHGGKRHCQKNTFKLIDKVYEDYLRRHDDLFILFIDSDCILDKACIKSFLSNMKVDSSTAVLAQTGVITSTTAKHSLITLLQDIEYVHGQLMERTVESGCGSVTCLPGALTIFRFSAFRQVGKFYFANKAEQCNDLFDYGKMHLGEDRWLTHLFMISSTKRYQIQMNTGATCKTEAVQTFRSLLKQRRRWFLGFITNEAVMLTDVRLWRRFTMLMVLRLAQDTIRTTALLFFIMVLSILTTSQKVTTLPVGFIAVSLGLNWVLMLYFGFRLGRWKMVLYPLMFVINPFFNWLYLVYAIFTASQRTWGGPRADASKADEETTVDEALEKAAIAGDDINIIPESFKTAAEARRGRQLDITPLMPPSKLTGRFRRASLLPGGWFQQINGSGVLDGSRPRRRLRRRNVSSSSWSTNDSSSSRSPGRPRRLESLVRSQARADTVPAWHRASSSDSIRSNETVEPHFVVPSRPLSSPHGPLVSRTTLNPGKHDQARGTPTQSKKLSARATSAPFRRLSRRLGRSPLARKSFTHLAADQKTITESLSIRGERSSLEEPRGRHRRRPSISVDSQGQRRLSKSRSVKPSTSDHGK